MDEDSNRHLEMHYYASACPDNDWLDISTLGVKHNLDGAQRRTDRIVMSCEASKFQQRVGVSVRDEASCVSETRGSARLVLLSMF